MINSDIRDELKQKGIKQWQLADALTISEFTLTRWLRTPIPVIKKLMILNAIEQISKNVERGE